MDGVQYETADQLKTRLRIGTSTLYRWIEKGLPSIKVSRSRRFPIVEVDRWLRMQKMTTPHPNRGTKRSKP